MADDILTTYEKALNAAAGLYEYDLDETNILKNDDSHQKDGRDPSDEHPGTDPNTQSWLQTGDLSSSDRQQGYGGEVDLEGTGPRTKMPNRVTLPSEASMPSETGGLSGSSAYFQALGKAKSQRWVLDNPDSGSPYTPRSAEFEGVNGDLEISDEALVDSALISYTPSEDVIPESESHHAAIFHAAQMLAENGALVVGDRIQASVSEDRVEEVVQAYEVLDRSIRRSELDSPNDHPSEEILNSYNPETKNDF